jgi:hypothetical protein
MRRPDFGTITLKFQEKILTLDLVPEAKLLASEMVQYVADYESSSASATCHFPDGMRDRIHTITHPGEPEVWGLEVMVNVLYDFLVTQYSGQE